jgi:hypothetical protein
MHFLRKDELDRLDCELGKPYAAVRVRVQGTHLVMTPGDEGHCIVICKMDTLFVPLPERISVVGPDGQAVKPSKGSRFWVTVETIDPFHLVTEAETLPLG